MNQDPTNPAPQPTESPEPTQFPAPEAPQTPVEPTPVVAETPAPVTPQPFGAPEAAAPVANPFGGAPVSSETPAANPFGQAAGPIGSSPVAGDPVSSPAPAGGSKKRLIILISAIVGGIIVLGAAAFLVYTLLFAVTKADYKEAYDQLSTVQQSVSSTSLTGSADELSTTFGEFKTANAKLADLKALKADKDLNVKYKAYDEKAKGYITFMDGFIPSFEKLKTATDALSGSSTTKSASVQATITALESASDVTDPSIKTYVDTLLATYKEILPLAKTYETATTSSDRLKAITAISASTKKLSAASTAFSTDLKERYDGVSPKETFDALSKAVTEKHNAK